MDTGAIQLVVYDGEQLLQGSICHGDRGHEKQEDVSTATCALWKHAPGTLTRTTIVPMVRGLLGLKCETALLACSVVLMRPSLCRFEEGWVTSDLFELSWNISDRLERCAHLWIGYA